MLRLAFGGVIMLWLCPDRLFPVLGGWVALLILMLDDVS